MLLGQRRMGKTEIFKRLVNRLFFEQNHKDPNAVIPVYYKFSDVVTDPWKFATEYVENFIKWYTAFRMRKPALCGLLKVNGGKTRLMLMLLKIS